MLRISGGSRPYDFPWDVAGGVFPTASNQGKRICFQPQQRAATGGIGIEQPAHGVKLLEGGFGCGKFGFGKIWAEDVSLAR